jgi:hypothetical protein
MSLIPRAFGCDVQLDYAKTRKDTRKAASHCRTLYKRLRAKGARKTYDEKRAMLAILDSLDAASARWGRDYTKGMTI